jgi:RimJ/RimL family protein N-acetyltransferase
MRVKSLGCRTDLMFPAFEGGITERGDHLIVQSPSNPTFYWGNFLLFSEPPREGEAKMWTQMFAAEIGTPPVYEHQAFGWDSTDGAEGAIGQFLEMGFEPDRSVTLTTESAPRPTRQASPKAVIRRLESEGDWQQAIDLQVACREPVHEEARYRTFRERSMELYRRMVEAGRGAWYGAYIKGRLIADLGVFHDQGVGRYQSVETHPDFRRQGVAGAAICAAGRAAFKEYGLHTLVIVAEEGSAAARLYESLGFEPTEKMRGLLRFPHAPRTTEKT